MKVSLILEAVNRMTGPIGAALRSIDRLNGSISRLQRAARSLGGGMMGLYDTTRDASYHFRRLAGEEGMARAARSAAYLKNQLSGLTGGLTLLKYASIGATIGLGEEFVRGVFQVGGQMQQMLVTLDKLEGGGAKARAAMAWMQNFSLGQGASLSMPDIMKSYQLAKEAGMNPQSGSLGILTDLAAAWRRPLDSIIFAVKDAMFGTSTRPLANLGIKMHQGKGRNDENSFNYQNLAGKWVTDSAPKTPDATLGAILHIINAKYGGIAGKIASTLPGQFAQVQKLLYNFEGMVALGTKAGGIGGGVFGWAQTQLGGFLSWARTAMADGTLPKLAARISKFMTDTGEKIIAFVRTTDWKAVGKDLGLLAISLGLVATAADKLSNLGGGGISGFFNLFVASKIIGISAALGGLIAPLYSVAVALFTLDFAALPISAIVIAIGALAAIAWLVYANWDTIGPKLTAGWNSIVDTGKAIWSGFLGFFERLWARIKAMVPSAADLMPKMPTTIGGLFGGGMPSLVPRGPQLGPPRLSATGTPTPAQERALHALAASGQVVAPKASVGIHVTADPGLQTKVTKLQGSGMDIDVKRGAVLGRPG